MNIPNDRSFAFPLPIGTGGETGPAGPPGVPGPPGGTVANSAELAAANPDDGRIYMGEAGREGWFKWDASNLAAAVALDPFQGIYIPPTSDPAGAAGSWVRVRRYGFVDIEWFGAKEWSFGDYTANIQSALDFAGRETGECFIPPKIYMQSATLQMGKACWLHGAGNWQTTQRPAGVNSGAYGSRLQWSVAVAAGGAADKAQILVESLPQGTQLIQPRVSDLIVDGNARAGIGVHVSCSTMPIVRSIYASQHCVAGVAFLPRGGNTVSPTFDLIQTTTGTNSVCYPAYGMIMDATGPDAYNTGGHGGFLHTNGTANSTGWGLQIGNQDAFLLDKLQVFGFGTTDGGAIKFTFDPAKGGGPSRKHYISYFAGGLIHTDPGCYGIRMRTGSEVSAMDIAPGSHLHLTIFDQATGDFYQTLDYKFTDERDLMASAAALSGATLSSLGSSAAVSFATGATNSATWTVPVPPDWNHGRIMGLRVIYGMSTADAAAQCRLKATVTCPRTDGTEVAAGSSVAMNTRTETFTVPGATVADTFYTADLQIAWPPQFKKRCALVVTLQRMADGTETVIADTSAQALKVVAVKALYKTDGPNATQGEGLSTTQGRWETGAWSMDQSYTDYIGGVFPFIASTSYEAETAVVLAAFTNPSPNQFQRELINRTIKGLKDAGLWTAFDMLYFTGQQEEAWSKVNWLAPGTHDLTEVGAVQPPWTRLQGYRGSASGYLSTGINWSALTKYTQNNCHAGIFIYNEASAAAGIFGTVSNNGVFMLARHTTNVFQTRCNNNTTDSIANTSSRGHLMMNRSVSTGYEQWLRGALVASPVRASAAVLAEEMVICRTSAINSANTIAAFHCGRALTSLEAVNLNRILAYHVGHMVG